LMKPLNFTTIETYMYIQYILCMEVILIWDDCNKPMISDLL